MGQVALGFRSLLIKLAIFFVMASLLAWALGGTLWPRAEIVDFEPVQFGGQAWFWRLSVGGREGPAVRYTMMQRGDEGEPIVVNDDVWADAAGPVIRDNVLYFAGQSTAPSSTEAWRLEGISDVGAAIVSMALPNRLAVEHQLGRLAAGLALEDQEAIRRRATFVGEPHDGASGAGS